MSGVADRSRIFETHTDIDIFKFKESDNNRLFMLKNTNKESRICAWIFSRILSGTIKLSALVNKLLQDVITLFLNYLKPMLINTNTDITKSAII